jgi:hypothetical protein
MVKRFPIKKMRILMSIMSRLSFKLMMAKANARDNEYCREVLFVGLDCWKVNDYSFWMVLKLLIAGSNIGSNINYMQ